MKVKSESEVAQSCLTVSDPMDCSLPGSSVHGIFQERVLEWGAIAFSGSSPLQTVNCWTEWMDGWMSGWILDGWRFRMVEFPDLGKQVFRLGSRSSKEAQHFCL